MKKVFVTIFILALFFLVGCSSHEGEELIEYHNNYVENINNLADQVDSEIQNSFSSETPEETYKLQTENVLPLTKQIKDYIESQKPESDPVKEIHELRLKQLKAWEEAFNLQYQALEKTIEALDEEVVSELLQQSDQKLLETAELGRTADERLAEIAEELNVNLN